MALGYKNVFVSKKNGGILVTSGSRRLNDLAVTASYSMEDMRETLDWLESGCMCSVFDLKEELFQLEAHSVSRDYTAIQTVLGLLQYKRLPQELKFFLQHSNVVSTVFHESARKCKFWLS